MPHKIDTHKNPVVFYDGYCGLCNWAIQFILKHDRQKIFRFATLQGDTAREVLSSEDREDLTTVVVWSRREIFKESGAFFEIVKLLGGGFKLLRVFGWLPRKFTDATYRFVARNRYSWFGVHDQCPLPDEKVRNRFLDAQLTSD